MAKPKLRCAGASDPGKLRRNNEDGLLMDSERGIFLVVDGIGGQAAGEKAAEIAIDRVRARLERQTGTAEERIREAITMANNEILRSARGNAEWKGMACVLTLALFDNGSAVIGHVGDSRLYRIRHGEISKITHDHSPVGVREDNQELTEAEAMRHPRRNEVFRDVGSEEHAPDDPDFIEVQRIPFEPDSALLLCSDGLSDQVGSSQIKHAVERNAGRPDAAVRELIEAANGAGGKDNVTVLVLEGEQFTAPAPAAASLFASRPAMLIYGLLLASAAAWFLREAPTIGPRVLTVGPGTIAGALIEARPGDTVEVPAGEYREQVRLKSDVTVRSREPREAVLKASPSGAGPAIVADDVKGARVIGFRIVADEQMPLAAGIVLTNSSVEVDDVEIEGAGVGIEIRGSASPVLRANAIHDCLTEGLLISGLSAPWISHNSFQRNKGAGLTVSGGAKPSLIGNTFEKNELELPLELRDKNFFLDGKPATGGKKK